MATASTCTLLCSASCSGRRQRRKRSCGRSAPCRACGRRGVHWRSSTRAASTRTLRSCSCRVTGCSASSMRTRCRERRPPPTLRSVLIPHPARARPKTRPPAIPFCPSVLVHSPDCFAPRPPQALEAQQNVTAIKLYESLLNEWPNSAYVQGQLVLTPDNTGAQPSTARSAEAAEAACSEWMCPPTHACARSRAHSEDLKEQ